MRAKAMVLRRSLGCFFVIALGGTLSKPALAAENAPEPESHPFTVDVTSATGVLRTDRRIAASTLGIHVWTPLAGAWLRGGLGYAVALSGVPSRSAAREQNTYALSGNVSAFTRAEWSSDDLFAAGYLELWLPTAAFDPAGPASSAAEAAQTTTLGEPWRFMPAALGGSIGMEAGFRRGPFIATIHQTLDAATIVLGDSKQTGLATTAAVLDFAIAPSSRIGLRIIQRYDLDSSVAPEARRRLQLGPCATAGTGKTVFEATVLMGEAIARTATSAAVLRLSLRHTW